MSEQVYNEVALKRIVREYFGIGVDIAKIVVYRVPVSETAEATLFLTPKKQLFLYVVDTSKLLFSDVKKIVARMGLTAELYMPPKGRPNYFDEIGVMKFHEVFPGRKYATGDDITFYRTLAPYNPALILISEVKYNGEVYQYDNSVRNKWRLSAKFSYRRIRTV